MNTHFILVIPKKTHTTNQLFGITTFTLMKNQ